MFFFLQQVILLYHFDTLGMLAQQEFCTHVSDRFLPVGMEQNVAISLPHPQIDDAWLPSLQESFLKHLHKIKLKSFTSYNKVTQRHTFIL